MVPAPGSMYRRNIISTHVDEDAHSLTCPRNDATGPWFRAEWSARSVKIRRNDAESIKSFSVALVCELEWSEGQEAAPVCCPGLIRKRGCIKIEICLE